MNDIAASLKVEIRATLVTIDRLVIDDAVDVRARGDQNDTGELEASILVNGVQQSLLCRPGIDDDRLKVVAGRRRLRACWNLAARKLIDLDSFVVPVVVRDMMDDEALEAALAENVIRRNLHPVVEYEGFARLAKVMDEGQIAKHFGIDVRRVRQRLALARLAPEVRQAWLDGKITQREAEAFTVTGDLEAQVHFLADFLDNSESIEPGDTIDMGAAEIRRVLSAQRFAADDRLALFVGLDIYTGAGGAIQDDLFEDARHLSDGALLKRLAAEKLAFACEGLKAEGWSWAAEAKGREHWPRMTPEPAPTDEEAAALEAIAKRIAALEEKIEHARRSAEAHPTKTFDEFAEALDRLEQERDAIAAVAQLRGFTAEDKARSGCFVRIAADGTLAVTHGVIRPAAEALRQQFAGNTQATGDDVTGKIDDGRRKSDDGEDDDDGDDESTDADDGSPSPLEGEGGGRSPPDEGSDAASTGKKLPSALAEQLSLVLTRAAAVALADDPDLMLAALAATLSEDYSRSPLRITLSGKGFGPSHAAGTRDRFAEALAGYVSLNRGAVLTIIAQRLAHALDMTLAAQKEKAVRPEPIAALLGSIDQGTLTARLRDYFDAEAFFKAAPRTEAVNCIFECAAIDDGHAGAAEAAKARGLKKDALAARATRIALDRGWLPSPLRTPGYALLATTDDGRQTTDEPAASTEVKSQALSEAVTGQTHEELRRIIDGEQAPGVSDPSPLAGEGAERSEAGEGSGGEVTPPPVSDKQKKTRKPRAKKGGA